MEQASRFGQFNDRERDLLRMALRRLFDERIMAVDKGIADMTSTEIELSALIYELNEIELS